MHLGKNGWLVLLIVLGLLIGGFTPALAQTEEPYLPTIQPPMDQPTVSGELATAADATVLNFPSLKAVLIVGPMDPANYLTDQLNTSKATAAALRSYGMNVVELYTPNVTWQQVKQEVADAQFILYRGHGIRWSSDETNVGGFALDDGLISPDTIRSEMKVGRNAIFMFFACYSSGSEGDPNREPVAETTASSRVNNYADAVLDIGAAGYYANWRGTGFQDIIRYLLQGKTLMQAYETNQVSKSTLQTTNTLHSGLDMRIGYDVFSSTSAYYDNTFTGLSNATIQDLFSDLEAPTQVSKMISSGSGIYDIAIPVKSALGKSISWTASITSGDGAWLPVKTWSGTTDGIIALKIDSNKLSAGSRSTAVLHIHTGDTTVVNPDLDVSINIISIAGDVRYTNIPLVIR